MQCWLEIWTWKINALASVEEEMLHERAVLSMVGDVPLFSIFFYVSCYITTQRADSGISYWVFSWPSSSSTSSSPSSSYQQWLLGAADVWEKWPRPRWYFPLWLENIKNQAHLCSVAVGNDSTDGQFVWVKMSQVLKSDNKTKWVLTVETTF